MIGEIPRNTEHNNIHKSLAELHFNGMVFSHVPHLTTDDIDSFQQIFAAIHGVNLLQNKILASEYVYYLKQTELIKQSESARRYVKQLRLFRDFDDIELASELLTSKLINPQIEVSDFVHNLSLYYALIYTNNLENSSLFTSTADSSIRASKQLVTYFIDSQPIYDKFGVMYSDEETINMYTMYYQNLLTVLDNLRKQGIDNRLYK